MSAKLTGQVVEVNDSGDLLTDISSESLASAPRDATLRVLVDEHETLGLHALDHSQPSMTLVAILEEGRPLRIVLVDDSASAMLGVQVGARVQVTW